MAPKRDITCCFTGHRPQKLPWGNDENDIRCQMLKKRIAAAIGDAYLDGFRRFLCGMATGCDTWFCEEALSLKEHLPGLEIHAVIPCETQPNRWSERDRNRYYSLLERCDSSTLLQTAYTPDCMMRRNEYMVDHSALLLAAYNGEFGGTMQTINYALRQGVELRYLEIPR